MVLLKLVADFTGSAFKSRHRPEWEVFKRSSCSGPYETYVEGAAKKILKVGFDTGIRMCYVAKKEVWNMSNRRNIRLIFRQYAAPQTNELIE